MADDERIIQLLTEIRDLQQRHNERYDEAVRNQQESIRAQQEAIRYQRTVVKRLSLLTLPVVIAIVVLVFWFITRVNAVL